MTDLYLKFADSNWLVSLRSRIKALSTVMVSPCLTLVVVPKPIVGTSSFTGMYALDLNPSCIAIVTKADALRVSEAMCTLVSIFNLLRLCI